MPRGVPVAPGAASGDSMTIGHPRRRHRAVRPHPLSILLLGIVIGALAGAFSVVL